MKKKSNIYNLILTIIAFLIPIILYSKLPMLSPANLVCQQELSLII